MPASNSLVRSRGLHELQLSKMAAGQLESDGQAFFGKASGQRDRWGSSHIKRCCESLQFENEVRLSAKGTNCVQR